MFIVKSHVFHLLVLSNSAFFYEADPSNYTLQHRTCSLLQAYLLLILLICVKGKQATSVASETPIHQQHIINRYGKSLEITNLFWCMTTVQQSRNNTLYKVHVCIVMTQQYSSTCANDNIAIHIVGLVSHICDIAGWSLFKLTTLTNADQSSKG